MRARLYKLAYQMKLHRFGDWSLERWVATAAWLVGAIVLLLWLVRGRPSLPAWHWAVLGLVLLLGLGWPAYRRFVERRGFILFRGSYGLALPHSTKMEPEDKARVRATGHFEVQGRYHFFAELEAFWRTYGSREHAVLAKVDPSRFLLLGNTPEEVRGMWYLFFKPQDIRAIEAGTAAFGTESGPALRVAYMVTPYDQSKKRQKKPYKAVTVLRFENEADRDKVWADLRYDLAVQEEAVKEARAPASSINGKLRL